MEIPIPTPSPMTSAVPPLFLVNSSLASSIPDTATEIQTGRHLNKGKYVKSTAIVVAEFGESHPFTNPSWQRALCNVITPASTGPVPNSHHYKNILTEVLAVPSLLELCVSKEIQVVFVSVVIFVVVNFRRLIFLAFEENGLPLIYLGWKVKNR